MKRLIAFSALLLLAGNVFAIMAHIPSDTGDTTITLGPVDITIHTGGDGNTSDKDTDNSNSDNSNDSDCNIQ